MNDIGGNHAPICEIRPIKSEDFEAVGHIIGDITREGGWWYFPEDSTDEQALHIWQEIGDVYVAEIDHQIAGTYVIGANHYGGSHIASCGYAVASRFRGRGIADALCRASQAEAALRGYKSIQLNAVLVSNEAAIKVYKRNGFEVIGRVPEGYMDPKHGTSDLLIMFFRTAT